MSVFSPGQLLHVGDDITFSYGVTAQSDALVGITEGGGAADPGSSDLSSARGGNVDETVYENFPFFPTKTTPFSDFDLLFDTIEFD